MKRILLLAFAALLLASCDHGSHFMTDKDYRMQVHADFIARQKQLSGHANALFAGMDKLPQPEREALEFLYAYMPYSDLADYDQAFYLKQVRTAFKARAEMPWGKTVPEDVFRHFVLVYRVNNENLDTARAVFYHDLKERVKDMSMADAALEVNHWCHEHVAYRASDSRTSAPLATMRTGYGRCGEESTFTVTALRAVGIPARQCYTPRWAHCDDNHAWVEVWIDGEWKFMGACEPDPQLNMGWFSVPSTRCMMVHTKVFGRYNGDEETLVSTPMYSELNLLSHYAPTRRVTVTVCSPDGRPVEGAKVKFKLYNYAEYYTLATERTDDWGQAFFRTGLGDLLVWVTDGTHHSYRKVDVRQDSSVSVILGRTDSMLVHNFEMVPPEAGAPKVVATDEEIAANSRRLAYEDALRNAYLSTFPTENTVRQFSRSNPNLTNEQMWDIFRRGEGNYAELARFLENHMSLALHLYEYLSSFSDKDMRDITADVLEAHFTNPPLDMPYEIYCQGIMPARISNEMVRPYREELAYFKGMSVDEIRRWIADSLTVNDAGNYYRCPISPAGVYRLRYTDTHSRDIFFVAACRAAGIPAYLDNATNTIYTIGDNFKFRAMSLDDVDSLDSESRVHNSTLTLTYRGKDPAVPVYWPHFTLARLEDGDLRTFDFEDDPRMSSFPATIGLAPGTYCLSTGSRYSDGAVNSRLEFFTIASGEKAVREIVIPSLTPRDMSIGTVNRNYELFDGIALWDYAGKPGMIYINLGNYSEPAKHLVVELRNHQPEMRRWGGMTFMVGPNNVGMDEWNLTNTDISYRKGELERLILNATHGHAQYPLVALIDKNGRILYYSEGYKIGVVEQVLQTANQKP